MNWPPIFTGSVRFLMAGPILLAVLRYTRWLGEFQPVPADLKKQLWSRAGLSLALYIVAFNWALHLTAASHVALYIGASPVWALVWEERPRLAWNSARRYGAAALALCGALVLFWPALQTANSSLPGEFLGFCASLLWATYSRQVRFLSARLTGTEVAAHSMWMAGIWLVPWGIVELVTHPVTVTAREAGVLGFCVLLGGVVPYALWNNALRVWRTSQVMLFNNLIPLSTTLWVFYFMHEPITHTFWMAMALIVAGVVLGQADWSKIFKMPESF